MKQIMQISDLNEALQREINKIIFSCLEDDQTVAASGCCVHHIFYFRIFSLKPILINLNQSILNS